MLERVEAAEAAEPVRAGEAGDAPRDLALYRGFAHLPDRDVPIEVRVDAGGVAIARLLLEREPERDLGPDAELARAAAAYVRSAAKAALASGRPPPRRVVRWRG